MGSITTFEFNSKIHWAKRRSDTSKKIIENTLNNYKNYIPNIIILKSTEDNYYAMNNQDGMQVIFNTYTLSTLYSKNKK
jgi:adenylate kinase family enzyme